LSQTDEKNLFSALYTDLEIHNLSRKASLADRMMDVCRHVDAEQQLVVKLFFNLGKKDAEDKVFCRINYNYLRRLAANASLP